MMKAGVGTVSSTDFNKHKYFSYCKKESLRHHYLVTSQQILSSTFMLITYSFNHCIGISFACTLHLYFVIPHLSNTYFWQENNIDFVLVSG